jgi:hypothetical protein
MTFSLFASRIGNLMRHNRNVRIATQHDEQAINKAPRTEAAAADTPADIHNRYD